MKRLLLIFAVVAALAAPAAVGATTNIQTFTYDATFPLCNGDLIHLSGPVLAVFTFNETPSGEILEASHFNPQGVTGVDLVTGTVFHATGVTRDLSVGSPDGASTETILNEFHVQSTDGAESFIVRQLIHVTFTANGTVTASFDEISVTCP
jgi:hypothetical protein